MKPNPQEIKPLLQLSADEKNEQFPFGICGLSTRRQAVLLPVQQPALVSQPGEIAITVQVVPLECPCYGPDCQLWVGRGEETGWCTLRHLMRLRDLAELFTPAGADPHPLDRKPPTVRDQLKRSAQEQADLKERTATHARNREDEKPRGPF